VNHIAASFSSDSDDVITGPKGQLAHRDHIDHTAQFERHVHQVRDGVWSIVGNGLSNQNFVEGPGGLIAIDTGESVQEMAWSLDAMTRVTDAPVVAVIYTHSHYVGGTAAIRGAGDHMAIWGHERITINRQRTGLDLSASATRGAVHQFGLLLDSDGPDGLVNIGLGESFRRADHAPHEVGFIPPTETIDSTCSATIAGLRVEFTPAPSDADDSLTIWFPELETAVHNIAWPALFNIFAIRGEPYRDPAVLVTGLDHLRSLGAAHLVCAHGLPISGAADIDTELTLYRDSIQFMWDQTVRGVNKDLTVAELADSVQLPEVFHRGTLTRQLYGIAEHHVRQIHHGLVGWFDGDEGQLFPLVPAERSARLVAGFGGPEAVRSQVRHAISGHDLRWAIEMGSWLVRRHEAEPADRMLLAEAVRLIGQRTTSANVRNWCITRARELEGSLDLDRFRVHLFSRGAVMDAGPATSVHALRVLVDPEASHGVNEEVAFSFSDGTTVGLRLRNHIAVPTDGQEAELVLSLDLGTWAGICSGRTSVASAIDNGSITVTGERYRIDKVLACFDHPSFQL
jgi:alkyl sulfatase BDS1-like metallo-beta-lactamase superfamily hydrolase